MKPEDLTNEVWDYIFLEGPEPKQSAIPAQTLQALRREFDYWYPFDLRVGLKTIVLKAVPSALEEPPLYPDICRPWHDHVEPSLCLHDHTAERGQHFAPLQWHAAER